MNNEQCHRMVAILISTLSIRYVTLGTSHQLSKIIFLCSFFEDFEVGVLEGITFSESIREFSSFLKTLIN
jgi:hypothetical protein